jgi:hypothetical protein
VVSAAYAQDNAQPDAAGQAPAAEQQVKPFDPLVRVTSVQGAVQVQNPDVGQFAPAQNNKAYPLGTIVRTGPGGNATLAFSPQDTVQLLENSEAVFAAPEKDAKARLVKLVAGKIKTSLRDNLAEGSFSVATPGTTCKNMAGRGEFTISSDANTETLQAATITGSAFIEGTYYAIPALRAANTVNIQTAADRSLTRLTSVSGDFPITLSNGGETPTTFGMSPKAVVKIWRENAPVGGRSIVSTLVVSPTGMARHRFAYAEGRPNLATGELIAPADEEEAKDATLPVLLSTGAAAPAAEQPKAEAGAAAQ